LIHGASDTRAVIEAVIENEFIDPIRSRAF